MKTFSPALLALSLLAGATIACADDVPETTGKMPAAKTGTAKTETAAPAAVATTAAAGKLATPPAPPAEELVVLETGAGTIVIDLYEDKTPGHAENMKKLVRQGWYDGSPFHRVIPGFMAQGGGKWGPNGQPTDVGYTIPAEIVAGLSHRRGTVAAARTGDQVNPERRSSGSQFYICFASPSHLDNQYTIFGEVVSGMEAVDKITPGVGGSGSVDPATATKIDRAWLKPKDAPATAATK